MMKNDLIYVLSKQDCIFIDEDLILNCSTKFMSEFAARFYQWNDFLLSLSALRILWVKPIRNTKYIEILFPHFIASCLIEHGELVLVGCYDKTIRLQNSFIKYGSKLIVRQSFIIKQGKQLHPPYTEKDLKLAEAANYQLTERLKQAFEMTSTEEEASHTKNNQSQHKSLLDWIAIQEEYEAKRIESLIANQPYIQYKSFTADLHQPFKLSFETNHINPLQFVIGCNVQIKTKNKKWIKAVLTERYTDGQVHILTLLFDHRFIQEHIYSSGIIYLSVEDVNRYSILRDNIKTNTTTAATACLNLEQLTAPIPNMDDAPIKLHFAGKLDNHQFSIFLNGIAAPKLLFVDGPAASGKTTLIKQWLKYFKGEGKKILYVTQHSEALYEHINGLTEEQYEELMVITEQDHLLLSKQQYHYSERIYHLKHKIELTVKTIDEKIINDKIKATTFLHDLQDLQHAIKLYDEHTEQLQKLYTYINDNYVTPMKEQYRSYIEQQQKLDTIYARIEKLKNDIRAYKQSNTVIKSLLFPRFLSKQKRVIKDYQEYEELSKLHQEVTNSYNNLTSSLVKALDSPAIIEQKELWLTQKAHIDSLEHRIAQTPHLESIHTSIHLLPLHQQQIDRQHIQLQDKLQKLSNDLLHLINQLEQLHIAYRQWGQDVLSKPASWYIQLAAHKYSTIATTMNQLIEQYTTIKDNYDVVIVDSAHRYQYPDLLIALSLAPKAIVLGDTLGSSIVSNTNAPQAHVFPFNADGANYLSKVLPNHLKYQLNKQYRIPELLSEISKQSIYRHVLHSNIAVNSYEPVLSPLFMQPLSLITTTHHINRFETSIEGHGYYNQYEALMLVELLKLIVAMPNLETVNEQHNIAGGKHFTPNDILITTFYDLQADYIRDHLRYAFPDWNYEVLQNMVKPIQYCEGVERPIVLVSLTRSNKLPLKQRNLDRLRSQPGWSLALTRASRHLILLGDIDYLQYAEHGNAEEKTDNDIRNQIWSSMDVAALIRSFIQLAKHNKVQYDSISELLKKGGREQEVVNE